MQSAAAQKPVNDKESTTASTHAAETQNERSAELGAEASVPVFLKPVAGSAPAIGAEDDDYEREADQVADTVMRKSLNETSGIQTKPAISQIIQPKSRTANGSKISAPGEASSRSQSSISTAVRQAIRSGDSGNFVEADVRRRVESQNDVGLMAHELTHVVQQRSPREPTSIQRQLEDNASPTLPAEPAPQSESTRMPDIATTEYPTTPATGEAMPHEASERSEFEENETESEDQEAEAQQDELEDETNKAEETAENQEGEGDSGEGEGENGGEPENTSTEATATSGGPDTAGESVDGGDGDHSGNLALIDVELAEHERWAGSFGEVGTAGSDQRARFILDQAGQGASSGAISGLGMGFAMGAIGGAIGQIAGRRLATLAVSRGFSATPVPGLGSAIGGVMALAGLATRDWGNTFDTIGRFGEGEGYAGLANDLEAIAEVLDLASNVADVIAGVLGGIAVGMWVGAVLSAGTLSPLAASLSAVAIAINVATTAIGVIINVVVRPTVTALRALHAFESQGDPAQIEAEGQQLQAAAGQVTGAVGGAVGGRLGGAAGSRGGTRLDNAARSWQQRQTGGAPAMSATGSGPRVHLEVPEAPTRVETGSSSTTRTTAPEAPSPTTSRLAATEGPMARSSGRPRRGGRRPRETRIHDSDLRAARDTAEARIGREMTADEIRSMDIRRTMGETIDERTGMAAPGGRLEPEFYDLPGHDAPPQLRPGHQRAWSHPDPRTQRSVEASLRREARAEFTQETRTALTDEGQHNARTLESASHLSPAQRENLLETPVSRSERRRLRQEGEIVPGEFPEGSQFHHRETVRDSPQTAGSSRAGLTLPGRVHQFQEHGGDYRAPVELSAPRDPDAMTRPGFGVDREAQPRARARHEQVAQGSESTGRVDRDLQIQYQRSLRRSESRLARLRSQQERNPTPARQQSIERLEAEVQTTRDFVDNNLPSGTSTQTNSGSPAASSPSSSRARSTEAPTSSHASHTETTRTTDRAAAMAQYHEQIRADTGRESGVWRGEDGTYYVMQGDSGSVAPPAAAGRLELVYHSHPTEADASMQGLVSQPSQAQGDLGVLQYQHGEGPVGARQQSELHFPAYDESGTHTGYGATRFAYDPTHPLPIQVQTTTPGGRPSTQRYASFADFEARTGIRAGGDTPAASTAAADVQLRTDVEGAQTRIREIEAGTETMPRGGIGGSQGRVAARDELVEQAQQEDDPRRPQLGPAYTASVEGEGLEPGTSIDLPINPAYPSPPGTTAELDALQEQIRTSQDAQQDMEATESSMESQAGEQRTQSEQLVEAEGVAQDLQSGRTSHQATTDSTLSTNSEQQSTASETITTLGRGAEEAAGLATLVISLRGFQDLAHLFSYLPGSLGRSAETARDDAEGLITSLNRVNETDAVESDVAQGQATMEANQTVIEGVGEQGQQTDEELEQGRQGVADLSSANDASLQETEATLQQANQERRQAQRSEDESQTAHDDLLGQLQSWATEHRQAREDAIQSAIEAYNSQGYRATNASD